MRNQQPADEFEEIAIELGNKMVVLKILPFDTDIEVDGMLKIDYHNIMGEILTFNVLFNRIANLRAEQQSIVSRSEMDLKVFEAQMYDEKKRYLRTTEEKATEGNIESAIRRDSRYRIKYEAHFETVKNYNYIDALYWSAQNKCGLLKVMSDKLKPEEFMGDLITDTVNGVLIKASKKLI